MVQYKDKKMASGIVMEEIILNGYKLYLTQKRDWTLPIEKVYFSNELYQKRGWGKRVNRDEDFLHCVYVKSL